MDLQEVGFVRLERYVLSRVEGWMGCIVGSKEYRHEFHTITTVVTTLFTTKTVKDIIVTLGRIQIPQEPSGIVSRESPIVHIGTTLVDIREVRGPSGIGGGVGHLGDGISQEDYFCPPVEFCVCVCAHAHACSCAHACAFTFAVGGFHFGVDVGVDVMMVDASVCVLTMGRDRR